MCEAARRLSLAAVMLPIWGIAPAGAQQAARYQALLDSLSRQWSLVRQAEQRRDAVIAADIPMDSVVVGTSTLLFRVGERDRAVAAAGLAWARLRPVLRGDTALVAGRYYLKGEVSRRLVPRVAGAWPVSYDRKVTAGELADALVRQMEEPLALKVEPFARAWIRHYVPLDTLTVPALRDAYRELLLSQSHVARECLVGDLAACAVVLGIREIQNPAAQLLGPEERRQLVAPNRRCVAQRDDEDCLRALASSGDYQNHLIRLLRGPLVARRTVLVEALRRGGDHAYARLVSARGPAVGPYLEAVSRVPLDTLLTSWLRAVQSARPRTIVLTRKAAWAGFLWFMLFAVVVVRSTRWRLA